MIALALALALALARAASLAQGPAHAVLAEATGCGDLLLAIARKPPGLVFERCRYLPDRQGKPLVATYRVGGARAAAVERALGRLVGLKRLRYLCCRWEAPDAQVRVRRQWYKVAMATGETVVHARAAWGAIGRFEVTVETCTEEI